MGIEVLNIIRLQMGEEKENNKSLLYSLSCMNYKHSINIIYNMKRESKVGLSYMLIYVFQQQIHLSVYFRDLTSTGYANDVPGRHIFRIDEKVLPGVCIRDLSKCYRQRDRQIFPGVCIRDLSKCYRQRDRLESGFEIQVIVAFR